MKDTASNRWKKRNPEKVKAQFRNWKSRNEERRKAYKLAYYTENREAIREYDRLRYLRPENIAKRELFKIIEWKRAYMQTWLKAHPEQGRLNHARRKARKRANGIGNTKLIAKWIRGWQFLKRVKCYWCGKRFSPRNCHSDHIISLSKGGAHSVENLCVSCRTCNMRKHDKPLKIWNEQIAEPVLL